MAKRQDRRRRERQLLAKLRRLEREEEARRGLDAPAVDPFGSLDFGTAPEEADTAPFVHPPFGFLPPELPARNPLRAQDALSGVLEEPMATRVPPLMGSPVLPSTFGSVAPDLLLDGTAGREPVATRAVIPPFGFLPPALPVRNPRRTRDTLISGSGDDVPMGGAGADTLGSLGDTIFEGGPVGGVAFGSLPLRNPQRASGTLIGSGGASPEELARQDELVADEDEVLDGRPVILPGFKTQRQREGMNAFARRRREEERRIKEEQIRRGVPADGKGVRLDGLTAAEGALVSTAETLRKDAGVRQWYMDTIRQNARNVEKEMLDKGLSPQRAANRAVELRNKTMEDARNRGSAFGKALAEKLKRQGLGLDFLQDRNAQRIFGENFKNLSDADKVTVWKRIVERSGQDRPSVSKFAKIGGAAARSLWLATFGIAAHEILSADDKLAALAREGAKIGGGVLGGMAGGGLAGLACGPGAPLCSGAGTIIGGIVGAVGGDNLFDIGADMLKSEN